MHKMEAMVVFQTPQCLIRTLHCVGVCQWVLSHCHTPPFIEECAAFYWLNKAVTQILLWGNGLNSLLPLLVHV